MAAIIKLMKIGKEYILLIIAGLFLLAYVLQSGVKPLTINLTSPYAFLRAEYWQTFPFTTAIILIRGLALFILPLWLFSFFGPAHYAKVATLLILSGLAQLYALQEVITGAKMVPLEWSLSLSLSGMALLLPTLIFFLQGLIHSAHQKISSAPNPFAKDENENDD